MIELDELQQTVRGWYGHKGFKTSPQTLVIGLMEEVGELATAILLTECQDFVPSDHKTEADKDVASEVGDCIVYLLALCNELGIKPVFKHF